MMRRHSSSLILSTTTTRGCLGRTAAAAASPCCSRVTTTTPRPSKRPYHRLQQPPQPLAFQSTTTIRTIITSSNLQRSFFVAASSTLGGWWNDCCGKYYNNNNSNVLQLSPWIWWGKKIPAPKGLEDFFPPDGRVDEDQLKPRQHSPQNSTTATAGAPGRSPSSQFQSSTDSSKKNDHKKHHKKNEPPPPLPENDNANVPGLLALLALLFTLRQYLDRQEAARGDQEITFVDFRNQLLQRGLVEKLVVVNQKLAQVVLKPHVTATRLASSMGSNGSSSALADSHGTVMEQDWHALESRAAADHHPREADATERFESVAASATTSSNTIKSTSNSNNNKLPRYYFYIGSVESLEDRLSKAQAHIHPEQWVEVQYTAQTNWPLELVKTLPLFAFLAALYFGSRGLTGAGRGGVGGGVFGIGKSNAKKIRKEDVNVTFADVAGCDEAKREIMEFVDFLKDSERFTKLGAKIPKGALLCGPPGTGKTLLAKATAGEAAVPFYSVSGSDFIEMFVGVGPSRVRDLFKEARANAPCIVFIDEIDAVGRQRGRGGFSGGNDERENTLNQLLVEMDGFSPTTGIVVLAGTNRADILDQALTRPGRFDRQVTVDKPDLQGRKEIFEVHLKGITLEGEIEDYAGRLAGLTPGFAGADIANICNEAAIVAARRKADAVSMQDFEKATDRIIGGLESNKIMSQEERSIVAHHEAGHAVAGWFLEHADPLLKVTIIPRTSGALGFAQYLPKEVFLRSQDQIMDIICMALAGRAAEEVFFGRVTTGASDDLRRVTQLVYSTIKDYGMSSKVGQLSFPTDNDQMGDKPYSDSTAEAMDDEARSVVDAAYRKTVDLIREKKSEVDKVANLLLDKETITHDDLVDLIGKRPFEGNSAYDEYVSSRGADAKKKQEAYGLDDPDEAGPENLTPGLA